MKKSFFRLSPTWSLIVILNLPVVIIGLITVSILFKNVSDDVTELNINTTTYMGQLSENIFEKALSFSYLMSDTDMYPDFHTFIAQKNAELSTPHYYLNLKNTLMAAANNNPSLPIRDIVVYSPLNDTAITTDSAYSFSELYNLYFVNSGKSEEAIINKLNAATAQAFFIPVITSASSDSKTPTNNILILCRKIYPYSRNSGFFFAVIDMEKFMAQLKAVSEDYLVNFGICTNDNTILFNESSFSYDTSALNDINTKEQSQKHSNKTVIYKPSSVLNIKYLYIFDKKNLSGRIPDIIKIFVLLELLMLAFSVLYGGKRAALIDKSIKMLSQSNFSLRKNLMESQLYLQTQIISAIINGKNTATPDVLKKKYEINLSRKYCRIMVIRFADQIPYKKILSDYSSISKTIFETLHNHEIHCYFASNSEPEYCMILNYDDEEVLHSAIFRLPQDILAQWHCGIPVYFGLSEKTTSFKGMNSLYEDAKSSVYYGIGNHFNITYFDDIKSSNLSEIYYPYEVERQLHNSVKFGRTDEASTILDKIYHINFVSRKPPYHLQQKLICLMQTLLYRLIDEMYAENQEIQNKYTRACRNITLNSDPSENYQFLREITLAMASDFESSLNCEIRDKIVDYIAENFRNPDFSLAMLAAYMNISYHHLSHIFTDYMGETFLSYLTNYRLEHAKELLLQSKEKIDTIAKLSGFSSSNTFIKIFKKNYGMTPGQYRSNGDQNENSLSNPSV